MLIIVKGNPVDIKRKEAKACVDFFAHELMTNRLCSNLYIEICFRKNLYEREQFVAACDSFDYHRPRDFGIEIDAGLDRLSTIRALAHETVHIKQYARGELRDFAKSKKLMWKGEVLEQKQAYWSTPWEIEAYRKEKTLLKKYLKFIEEK